MPAAEPPPTLYVFFGLIATGKSVLARAWAERHDCLYANSDIVRKELAGLAPTTRRSDPENQGIYTAGFSRQTYDHLLEKAAQAVTAGGRCVVLDASYQARTERDRVRHLAERLGCRLCFIWCTCPEDEIRRRLALRAADPTAVSDGRWEIYLKQRQRFEPPSELESNECINLDTRGTANELLAELSRIDCQKDSLPRNNRR